MKSFARGRKKRAVRPPDGQPKLPETEDSDAFETLFAGALGENGLPGLDIPHDVDPSRDADSEESLRFVRGGARENSRQESPGAPETLRYANQRANSPTFSFADPNEVRPTQRNGDRFNSGKRGDVLRDVSDRSAQGSTASGATAVSTVRFASSDEEDTAMPSRIPPQESQQRHERRTHRVVGAPPGLPTDVDLGGVRDWNGSLHNTPRNPAFNIVVEDFDALAETRGKNPEPKQVGLPSSQESSMWKERYFKLKDEYDALSTAHAHVMEQYKRVSAELSKTSRMPSTTSTSNVVDLSLQQAKEKITQQNEEIQALLEQRIAVEAELAELRFSSLGRDAVSGSEPHASDELKKALRMKDKTIEALKAKLKQGSGDDSNTVKKKKKGWFGSSSSSKKSDSQKEGSASELKEPQAGLSLAEMQIEKTRLVELERENAKLSAQTQLLQQDKAQTEEKLEALQLQLELLIQKKAVDEVALRDAATRSPPPFPMPEGAVALGPEDKPGPHWQVMFQLQQAATEKLSLKNQQLEDMLNTYAKSTANLKKRIDTPGPREEVPATTGPEEVESLRNEVRSLLERVTEKERQLDVSNTTLVHQKEEMEERNEVTQTEIARLRDKVNSYRTMIGNLLARQTHVRDRLSDTQRRYLQDVQEYQSEVRALRDGREARCPQATNPPNHRVRAFGTFGVRVAGCRPRHPLEEQNPKVSSRTAPAQLESTNTPYNVQERTGMSQIKECGFAQPDPAHRPPIIGSVSELRPSADTPPRIGPTAPEPEQGFSSQSSILSHNSCVSNEAENRELRHGRDDSANGFCTGSTARETQLRPSDLPLSRSNIRPVVVVEINDPNVSAEANAVQGLDNLAVPMPIVTDADRALALASLKRWVKNGRWTKNLPSSPRPSEQRNIVQSTKASKPEDFMRPTTETSDTPHLRAQNGRQLSPLPLMSESEAHPLAKATGAASRGHSIAPNNGMPHYAQDNDKAFFPSTWSKQPHLVKEPLPKIPLPAPATAHRSINVQNLPVNSSPRGPIRQQLPTTMLHNTSLLPSSEKKSLNSVDPDTYALKQSCESGIGYAVPKICANIPYEDTLPLEDTTHHHHSGLPRALPSRELPSSELIHLLRNKPTAQGSVTPDKNGSFPMPTAKEVYSLTGTPQRVGVDRAVFSAPSMAQDTLDKAYETKAPRTSSLAEDIPFDPHLVTRVDSDDNFIPRYRIRGGTVEDLIHDLDQEQDAPHLQCGPIAGRSMSKVVTGTTQGNGILPLRPADHLKELKKQADSWDELAGNL